MEKDIENKAEREINIMSKKPSRKMEKLWLVEIFFTSLSLSVIFALISELMLSNASLALSLFLIFLLISLSVLFDLIGVAVTACSIKPLLEARQKNIKGADIALKLVKKADKVSCICTDVVGDICSILSGAGGVAISIILITKIPNISSVLMSIIINAVIASITILGKAIGKSYALNCSSNVVIKVGSCLSFFRKKKNKR